MLTEVEQKVSYDFVFARDGVNIMKRLGIEKGIGIKVTEGEGTVYKRNWILTGETISDPVKPGFSLVSIEYGEDSNVAGFWEEVFKTLYKK